MRGYFAQQPCVTVLIKIKHCSIVYFIRVTMLQRRTSIKGGTHTFTCCIDRLIPDTSMQHTCISPSLNGSCALQHFKYGKTFEIPYSGKCSREKTFTNFAVLWLFAKVFSAKFGGVASFGTGAICESFLRENCTFHQSSKVFSLESFPLHGTQQDIVRFLPESSTCIGVQSWVLWIISTFITFCERKNHNCSY